MVSHWVNNKHWKKMCTDEDGKLDVQKFEAGPNEKELDRLEIITDAEIQEYLNSK